MLTPRSLTAPSFIALVSVLNLAVLATVIGLVVGPHDRLLAANGQVVCGQFFNLVQDVRVQSRPVASIRQKLDDLETEQAEVDQYLRPAVKGFVHAGREAASSFYIYPTFDFMAYSESYEHMDEHMMTQDSIKRLTKICDAEGFTAKSLLTKNTANAAQTSPKQPLDHPASPPADAKVKDAPQTVTAVQQYLMTKPWGFFGANCNQWATIHYRWDMANISYAPGPAEWVVDLPRDPAALGPVVIRYHVNAYSGLTTGDPSNNVRSQFAEGCDQY